MTWRRLRNRKLRAALGHQPRGVEPAAAIAAVARDLEDRAAVRDLAEGDVAVRHAGRV